MIFQERGESAFYNMDRSVDMAMEVALSGRFAELQEIPGRNFNEQFFTSPDLAGCWLNTGCQSIYYETPGHGC